MVLQCPDSRQYVLDRDAAIALGVSLLSVASKLYPLHGGAFREAVCSMFALLDDPPPAAEENAPAAIQRLTTPPQAARS